MFYNKYRPQTISELDNERIKETLGQAVLNNKFASAYLLTGGRGTGKTTTARIIAKLLNCPDRKVGEEPCDKCDSCKAIIGGSSLDVIEIDAASNTSVEDVRDLREKAKLAPSQSKYKVYIIDEVHMLSNSAFNALLKILEEPPKHVVFILATTDPQKMPPTVISRCQRYDFGTASTEELKGAIKRAARGEGVTIDPAAIGQLAQLASGSLRDAHKLLEQLTVNREQITTEDVEKLRGLVNQTEVLEILNLIVKKKTKEALEWLEKYTLAGNRARVLIEELVAKLRGEVKIIYKVTDGKRTTELDIHQITNLLERLERAWAECRDSVVESLPLELVVVEFGETPSAPADSGATEGQGGAEEKSSLEDNDIVDKKIWAEVLEKVKPFNHSLTAFLKAGRPTAIKDDLLVVEVAYKFHLDKLSEDKNRRIVEQVAGDIMPNIKRVKFELAKRG